MQKKSKYGNRKMVTMSLKLPEEIKEDVRLYARKRCIEIEQKELKSQGK